MYLANLKISKKVKKRRIARGSGGKATGRGYKRCGKKTRVQFEGGQTPICLRLPKRHEICSSSKKEKPLILNLGTLKIETAEATIKTLTPELVHAYYWSVCLDKSPASISSFSVDN